MPCESVVTIPNFCNASAASFGGSINLLNIIRNARPLVDASILLLLMIANDVDNSSTDIPNAAAGAPAYWIAFPNPTISKRDLFAAI